MTVNQYANRLKQRYLEEIVPVLMKEFNHSNKMAVSKIEKIVINMGVTKPIETRDREQAIANIVDQFKVITGQAPQITRARMSIAGFKLRQGDAIGVMVTLRGQNMWEFMDKLVSITLPRVKDFRGVPKTAFDHAGNYNLGMSEQIVFPELNYDNIESVRGLQITIVMKSQGKQESYRLLELMGMPFTKE